MPFWQDPLKVGIACAISTSLLTIALCFFVLAKLSLQYEYIDKNLGAIAHSMEKIDEHQRLAESKIITLEATQQGLDLRLSGLQSMKIRGDDSVVSLLNSNVVDAIAITEKLLNSMKASAASLKTAASTLQDTTPVKKKAKP